MRDPSRFAAFVLTHGRPDRVDTVRALRRHGYTGRIYLVVDDEDDTAGEYRERFGEENVLEFSKAEVAKTFDAADLSTDRRAIVYARNASQEIARNLGLDYLIQLDDDYTAFIYRFLRRGYLSRGGAAGDTPIRRLDDVFRGLIGLLEDTGALTVAMSQGGDHMGGAEGPILKGYRRKAMNSFVIRTDRPIRFVGRLNEDVNAYTLYGSRGELFLTLMSLQLQQRPTQMTRGGMSETYLEGGTYLKSFYTVMMCPSFVQIRTMGRTDRRLHHRIDWSAAVPKILAPELRRAAGSPPPPRRPADPVPRYPIFIPSRGRADNPITAKLLKSAGVPFRIVVEPAEADAYARAVGRDRILVLPWDNPPGARDGAVRARNWIKDLAVSEGAERHWQIDDDIRTFYHRIDRKRVRCGPGEALRAAEDLSDSFENVDLTGLALQSWVFNGKPFPPYRTNRNVAGTVLVRSEIPYRYRALQEDLDLTLQVLSGGRCTILMYDYLIDTPSPASSPGGLSEAYAGEGKRIIAESVAELWPGLVRVRKAATGLYGATVGRGWSRFTTPLVPAGQADGTPRASTYAHQTQGPPR